MQLLLVLCLACAACGALAGAEKAPLDSRIRATMVAPLVADALCLPTHYEYDAIKIRKRFGTSINEYTGSTVTHGVGWGARNYHNGNGNGDPKKAGEQTDYGDYNLLMLEHLATGRDMLELWKERLATWRSWICTQTKYTLSQVNQGVPFERLGGNSNAMALRFAGAFAFYKSEEECVKAAKRFMFTHRSNEALDGGEFFARVTFRVLYQNLTPREAITQVGQESNNFIKERVQKALDKVAEATNPESDLSKREYVDDLALTSMEKLWDVGKSEPIKVGKASPTSGTLPGAIYFIIKYQEDFVAAATANALVGGDNASRSIALGMVLGAYHGMDAIPQAFKDGLVNYEQVQDWLSSSPLLTGGARVDL